MSDFPAAAPTGASTAAPHTPSLILLAPSDNVLVCAAPVVAGQSLMIDGETFAAPNDAPIGHKVARRALAAGEKVLKYGAPIGSMKADAARGAHVHAHNLASDYIPSHTRALAKEPEA